MSEHYDLIVLGGGSAARDGAKRAANEYGAKAALVESTRWGGDCPNVACKPTKAYLVSAELVHDINTLADLLGIEVGPAKANLAKVHAHKESLKKPQPKWVEELRAAGFDTFDGTATLVDAHTVRVDGEELSAERILVATGSRTAVPPIDGIDDVGHLDHVTALDLTELPDSMLVVGAGAVGLEFAQMIARFGSRITLVDVFDRISFRSDADAADELAAALTDEGIEIWTSTVVKKVAREGAEIVATLEPKDGGAARELRVAQILIAAGRKPNIEELGLERAGVETTKQGIAVDEHLRTSAPGIWAAGDVTGIAQFTPVAQYQARVAIADMFGVDGPATDYSILPTAIFTDPELASVGLTEDEAREQGHDVETSVNPLKNVTRSQYTDTKRGLFKLVFERGSRRLLGMHIVARGSSDIIQGFALAMKLGASVDDLATMHHAFPSIAEGVKAAAEQAPTPVKTPP
jgi:mercuric reductase